VTSPVVMVGSALLITLALVLGKVACHPTDYTVNDEVEERIELVPEVEPFENTNPSRVDAGELYQSDMLLTDEQWESLKMRKAISYESYRWTKDGNGIPQVPYVFLDNVDQDDVRRALKHWESHTCIQFFETDYEDQPHLQFHIDNGCWSYVGMLYYYNGQKISIGQGCNSLGTVVHEVGHALGFHHEQSRSDRDGHVIVLEENIQDGKAHNFDKENDNNYNVSYDYSSNMHYGESYFTKNGKPTLITIDPLAQELIGSRSGLTHRDKLLANRMYNCTGLWLAECGIDIDSDPCQNDGYTGNDCTCVCPPGTSGDLCEEIVNDYYYELRSPLSEKITTEKLITIITPIDTGSKSFIKWIVPPTCMEAKVTFTSSDMNDQCGYNHLNVKIDAQDYEGQKLCPSEVAEMVSSGEALTSDSQIVITMQNWMSYSSTKTLWEASVTFEPIPDCSGTPGPSTVAPVPMLECEKKKQMTVVEKGTSVIIASPNYPEYYSPKTRCGWKLKASRKSVLTIDCDTFYLNDGDSLKINRQMYTSSTGTITAKKLKIQFKSKRKSSSIGFHCTVVST